ncbi:MAG: glycolate oxidase subunit GlcF [Meiothermus sp.]|uniref:glycolate oxidase subunit GlcF n=1 Tax=Meiothermus sp. TaxID=1955249 RepID=UPI0025D25353|nr:glycolate oxidase subunit GlcF [Meiothermus sp.]MCS7058642.1 glycolate oxidase subunit GlcF [Meiothermus sp.]MCS7193902.1 glycolate oxidase subunit GlcF [Meiothermus sp.]MCX7739882.1 glycolate oxidase subunit GlcF [Meiothermus sp.]MDW8090152.1 glycolate oxidase subunit GlcF [Meiothermus sp.]MDW8481454.1 glycolate oxidase subunit GlcF [Meiothermus sp.]
MQHRIDPEKVGPQGEVMAHAIEACVHCGFCLPACPTYQVLGEEMDSPRGRIFLMKEVLEGSLSLEEAQPYIDKCLGCLGCVTACPSGVPYGELITSFRAYSEPKRRRPLFQKAFRMGLQETLPYPARFRAAARLGRLARPLKPLLPSFLRAPLELLPAELPPPEPLPERVAAEGERRARVAFLAGCAQQVLQPGFNRAALRVLARNGVEVVIPKGQVCCGALALHTGERERALRLARQNLRAFSGDYDAILTNAAGCGSGLKEYPLLFRGEAEEEEARALAQRVKDIAVFLVELGLREVPPLKEPLRVAYHDACHLAHAQGVRAEPRALLRSIPGVELVEIPEGELCCGSAGTYNLEQPQIAATLGERKARNILATGAQVVVTGNIGCHTQIQNHLRKLGQNLPVLHTVELLDKAYAGQL